MALSKIKQLKGFDWSYHKIINCNIDIISQNVQLQIASYKDRNERLNGERLYYPKHIIFDIPFSDLNLSTLTDFRTELYRCLKLSRMKGEEETNFFTDASDVLE